MALGQMSRAWRRDLARGREGTEKIVSGSARPRFAEEQECRGAGLGPARGREGPRGGAPSRDPPPFSAGDESRACAPGVGRPWRSASRDAGEAARGGWDWAEPAEFDTRKGLCDPLI